MFGSASVTVSCVNWAKLCKRQWTVTPKGFERCPIGNSKRWVEVAPLFGRPNNPYCHYGVHQDAKLFAD